MKASILHRKDSLILTAIEILDEIGIQGLSTREIARREGISEATLFRHFKSKNDLICSIFDFYSQFDADIITSTRLKMDNPLEAILYYINSYAEYYSNYPAITSISQLFEVFTFDEELQKKVKAIVSLRTNFIRELIDSAKAVKEIPEHIDSEKLAYVIWGTLRSVCLKWRFDNYEFSLKEYTNSTIAMILIH